MTEADFQRNVIQLAALLGWRVALFRPARTTKGWRTPMQGDPGYLDLTLARRGRVVIAELKSETGRLTADQKAWIDALTGSPAHTRDGAGVEVYVWRPSDIDQIGRILK